MSRMDTGQSRMRSARAYKRDGTQECSEHNPGRRVRGKWVSQMAVNSCHVPTDGIQTRTIMTSVDLMRAAAVWPFSRRISRAASAVMMDEMRCPPMDSLTWASKPL